MSQCVVPNWNIRKEQDEDEEGKRSAHVQNQHRSLPTPMSNYEVTELRWENGHLAMHGFGGITDLTSLKPMFQTGETLESVVHQATHHKCIPNLSEYDHKRENMNSVVASSGGKWVEDSLGSDPLKKRAKTQSGGLRGKQHSSSFLDVGGVNSTGTTSFQETDTNTTTWASFDSPGSLMKTRTTDEDSACRSGPRNQDEERETKTETGRSFSTRRSRAAAVHNQSERRRRDKINQKMKALQKLVPNSSKTDKASMLDEVIDYLKQLQAQIHMMSLGNMPHMMMPLGMQQHLQMSLLARMGMGMGLGMGMGMLDMNTVNRAAAAAAAAQPIPSILHPTAAPARPTPAFVPPPFLIPPLMPAHSTTRANPEPVANHPMSLPDPYSAFLTQSMNVDLYNKMAALYRQQMNQTTHSSAPRHGSNAPHD